MALDADVSRCTMVPLRGSVGLVAGLLLARLRTSLTESLGWAAEAAAAAAATAAADDCDEGLVGEVADFDLFADKDEAGTEAAAAGGTGRLITG